MQKQQIVHLFNDDKFIDSTIDLFESVIPDCSLYYILKKKDEKFTYVKSTVVNRLDYTNSDELLNFIFKLNQIQNTTVFFHALDTVKQDIALSLHHKIKKVWFVWGYDLYDKWPLFKNNIYENETKKALSKSVSIKKKMIFNNISFNMFRFLLRINNYLPAKINTFIDNNYNTAYYKAVNLMDVVVPVIPLEFDLVKKINNKLSFAPFTYGCLEGLLGDNFDENVLESSNILIGNSANPTNNHLDIFKKLASVNLENRKIYVPLSYSGSNEYISLVINKGKELWGENFIPITTFIPLEEYNTVLLSCNVLIFNHSRQQGVGNIITLGYLGAKIFLNKKSPVYQYYKQKGISIYSIQELDNQSIKKTLTNDEFLTNRKLFLKLYSKENVILKIEELLTIVNKLKK